MKNRSLTLLMLVLTGCNLAPCYRRPPYPSPCTWRVPIDQPCEECVNIPWWQQFGDPVLDQLIIVGLRNNQDIKIAASRVCQFFYQWKVVQADQYPQITEEFDFLRQQPPGGGPPENQYTLLTNLDWDLDFWGRLRNLSEAAFAEYLQRIEARRVVVQTLVANLASGYVTLLQFDKQLEIGKKTLIAREKELKIAQVRFSQGLVSEMDVKQAESELDVARAAIIALEILIQQQENLLSVLLGQNPCPILRGRNLETLILPDALPASLPCALLDQRPDIIEAEQAIIEAGANIGAARALFFPKVTLTGFAGGISDEFRNLLSEGSRTWGIGINVLQTIFDGGRIYANLQENKAIWCEALHVYILAIQKALQEVNDALIAHVDSRRLLEVRRERVQSLKGYYDFATKRYMNGESDYLTVLDAERSLFNAELDVAETQADTFRSLIDLYRALGGGWIIDADCEAKKGGICRPMMIRN